MKVWKACSEWQVGGRRGDVSCQPGAADRESQHRVCRRSEACWRREVERPCWLTISPSGAGSRYKYYEYAGAPRALG